MNPHDIFTDVRKAYRLLHDYQRMVLDALQFVSKQLEIPYSGGHHKYAGAAPRNGKGSLDCWSWDWLGQIFYEFCFHDKEKQLHLSVFHLPDTGALDTDDKTNTASFPIVEKSTSRIAFVFTRTPDKWDASFSDKREERLQLAFEGTLPQRCTEIGMLSFSVSVEELTSEENAKALVERIRHTFKIPSPVT